MGRFGEIIFVIGLLTSNFKALHIFLRCGMPRKPIVAFIIVMFVSWFHQIVILPLLCFGFSVVHDL